jgi:segregation and condensation protein B
MENINVTTEESTKDFHQALELPVWGYELAEQENGVSETIEVITEDNWQDRTGLTNDTLCGAVETIIFMSDKPIELIKLKNFIDENLPLRVLHDTITKLQEEYEKSHHGIRLVEIAEGFQFRTKATYSKYVQDIFKVHSLVLTPTALEVLAIVAYKGPVTKNDVEKIRGVDSSHILRALMDKRLVRITGRSDELGRPSLYGTTPEFLEVFNLKNLNDLPALHELETIAQSNDIGEIADIKTLVSSGVQDRFNFDEIDELDKLGQSIRSVSVDTLFTKSLKSEEKRRKSDDGAVIKSAFELLEEHIDKETISSQNQQSSLSELLTSVAELKIIDLLKKNGPYNAPEIDQLEEELSEIMAEKTEEVITEDVSFEDEERELVKALDDAFDKLTNVEDSFENLIQFDDIDNDNSLSLDEDMDNEIVDNENSIPEDLQELVAEQVKNFEFNLDSSDNLIQ